MRFLTDRDLGDENDSGFRFRLIRSAYLEGCISHQLWILYLDMLVWTTDHEIGGSFP